MQDVWTEMLQAQITRPAGRPAHARRSALSPGLLVGPALLWTALFFILPFAAMVRRQPSGPMRRAAGPLANYRQFFANPSYFQAMVNSLEVTADGDRRLAGLAYPFAWILAERCRSAGSGWP